MYKFLFLGVISTTLLVVLWPTMIEGQSEDPMANMVSFPSAKIRRAMETEEFLKDGDRNAARKRTLARQRRANEENTPENVKRARRNIVEAEDEDEGAPCVVRETDRQKRGDYQQIKGYLFDNNNGIACTQTTKVRFEESMTISSHQGCIFEEYRSEIHVEFLNITCNPEVGSWAPVGYLTASNNQLNVVENNGKAAYSLVVHELLHTCGLYHTHQEHGALSWIETHGDCIRSGYEAQFDRKSTKYLTDSCSSLTQGVMMYTEDAFINDNCPGGQTISSLRPDAVPSDTFGSFKTFSWVDFEKFNQIYCDVSDTSSLDYGQVKGCNEIWEYGPEKMDIVPISLMSAFYITMSQEVGPTKSARLECPGDNFQITQVVWNDLKPSARCRKGNCKILDSGEINALGLLSMICGSGSAPGWQYDLRGHSFIVDCSYSTQGVMQIEYHCSMY